MQYRTNRNLNLYDSPALKGLVTQAAAGRYLWRLSVDEQGASDTAFPVRLCEDDYPGWLAMPDLSALEPTAVTYAAPVLSAAEIADRIPQVIAFAQAEMAVPNQYLWGGTVAPDYDCSGLMQAAFAAVDIRLPRDAYQQAAFVQPVITPRVTPESPDQWLTAAMMATLQAGDLVFFGTTEKINHVGLYLADRRYIHSSGKDQGRNGIGIDVLTTTGDEVSQRYYAQFYSAGRVVQSYQPQN